MGLFMVLVLLRVNNTNQMCLALTYFEGVELVPKMQVFERINIANRDEIVMPWGMSLYTENGIDFNVTVPNTIDFDHTAFRSIFKLEPFYCEAIYFEKLQSPNNYIKAKMLQVCRGRGC
ncbi:hypothetical protein PCE1_004370 [Barthelona sp. PCE]